MANSYIPNYMIGGELFTGLVSIEAVEGLDMVHEGKDSRPKKSKAFPGRLPFRYTVEFLRGVRSKKDPSGVERKFPEYGRVRVKVWAEQEPKVAVGDFARLVTPMVGAMEGSVFVQALGLQKYEPKKEVK